VSLAKANARVQVKRVVDAARISGGACGCGVRKLVGWPDDEFVKCVARVKKQRPELRIALAARSAAAVGGSNRTLAIVVPRRVERRTVRVSDDFKLYRYRLPCDTLYSSGDGCGKAFFQPGRGERAFGADNQTITVETERLRAFK